MRDPRRTGSYEVVVVGAGPVGCVAALACAQQGRRVLLLEANPGSSRRLAGEWLHPPAIQILQDLGVDLHADAHYPCGLGFVVYPDDGSGPVVLPYGQGSKGFSGDHGGLVEKLREHCRKDAKIDYVESARATKIDGQRLTYRGPSGDRTIVAEQIVAASGRSSVAHEALGPRRSAGTYSRMAGLVLPDADLPFEGYGHVCLGGLGPLLAYRIDERSVRMCIDVPLALRINVDMEAVLYEAYAAAIPEATRPAFREALRRRSIAWASNQIRPRVAFGRPGLALVGDAVGFHHPLTAQGMTLGFQDAVAFARAKSFAAYRRERMLLSRVPEMLAVSLYEVFADTSDEVVVIRRAIYDLWRGSAVERRRTMRFLGCQDTSPVAFGSSFLKTLMLASRELVRQGRSSWRWGEVAEVGGELSSRIRWLVGGALHLTSASPTKGLPMPGGDSAAMPTAEERYGGALKASTTKADVFPHPAAARAVDGDVNAPEIALARSAKRLIDLQGEDGSWEGEVVWCPMLAAQYVIACSITGQPIDPERRRRLLLQFETTRLPDGTWGLHEFLSEPYLFVTSLVYVAARLLGVPADDPLVDRGLAFIRAQGGVVAVPSWGKFWLAMLGLYGWDGVSPVLPEAWSLPRWMPLHPKHLYCHTRLIYLAMATIYAERVTAPRTPLIDALRDELYPQGFDAVDFPRARFALRSEELVAQPGRALRTVQRLSILANRLAWPAGRRGAVSQLREHIRFELRATEFTSISPVSGLLNVIALHAADPDDGDARRALAAVEQWMWEDDVRGTRIAGARSASWDSGLAAQALAAADDHVPVAEALGRADAFLAAQQIKITWPEAARFHRTDPRGGYCFSEASHGWPVSDCTAEALLGRIASPYGCPSEDEVAHALEFILRCRNRDGGFSAYEPRRLRISLEWMNPAEMFADSMTESSFVECTASCVAAMVAARRAFPSLIDRPGLESLDRANAGGVRFVRDAQHREGSWPGAWGVRLIYGTLFGVRGLVAAGVPPTDPALRRACSWLKSLQRPDGSWSELHAFTDPRVYAPGGAGQVTQTAWALTALLMARDPDWNALDRAARFLAVSQQPDGAWPRENPAGIFFRTALLDYALYKSYFPVWALAHYESRRKERGRISEVEHVADRSAMLSGSP
jgi:lanosterol synthase